MDLSYTILSSTKQVEKQHCKTMSVEQVFRELHQVLYHYMTNALLAVKSASSC